jgi:hypothetical protein
MIKLDDKYAISATEYCYTLGIIAKQKDRETGEEREYISQPIYPTTIEGCISSYLKIKQLELVRTKDMTLPELLTEFQKLTKETEAMLKKHIKEKI